MDIDRVRYFNIFAESGSLVKASEVLGVSQPALSKALKVLEAEVGQKLIVQEGRGLRLTSAGESFRRETKPLLEQWFEVKEKLRRIEAVEPTRIGTFEVFSTYFLKVLTGSLELENLELQEFSPGKLEDALLNHVVDLGITYLPIPKTGIEFIEITKVRMGVYGTKVWEKKNFADIPFAIPISPVEGAPSKVIGLDGWPDHKVPRQIAYRVTLMESALELCRQGRCIAYLPTFIADLHNQQMLPEFRLHELNAPILVKDRMQPVYLVQRSRTPETKLHRKVAKALRNL